MILMWHSASLVPRKWLLHWYHICDDLLPMAMYLKMSHPVMRPSLGFHYCNTFVSVRTYFRWPCIWRRSQPVMRPSLGFLGGFFMISRSGGLKPRAVAGSPSVTRFTHRSWTGIRASGIPRAAVRKILKQEHRIISSHKRFRGLPYIRNFFRGFNCLICDLTKINTAKNKPYYTSSLSPWNSKNRTQWKFNTPSKPHFRQNFPDLKNFLYMVWSPVQAINLMLS